MAKVSLRIYNREIENLVESGQQEEAIAHCRHVLNAFPKNLETYRLLGKAYLESKRYNEAIDIFERVLMAVPDDFVSHVGMSIIHDEQNKLDAAIWHMERAFEVQPSNAAIQAELQRLFGRRDGVEPPKIRLTRGSLAHMYVQGELYPQAISEITSVLEEDPERQDMQVLLARAYFHSGQKSEAAEICSQLIRRYPYCFDANRVLVEIIPQTERGESTQVYRHRVSELDPYATFTTGSVFHTEEVSDAAVSLERLEWDGQPVDMGPEWGDSLGIGRSDKPAAGDEQPDWLKSAMTDAASSPGEEPAPASETAAGDEDIPEFMRAAGWGESTGAFQEGLGTFDDSDEAPAGDLVEGDLPDWVKAMAPADAEAENASQPTGLIGESEDLTQDDVPDWLQGLGDVQSAPSAEQPSDAGEDVPDWLESMKPEETPEPETQGSLEAEPAGDEGLPDWLASMKPEESPAPEPLESPESEAEPAGDEGLPDWLQPEQLEEGLAPGEAAPATPESLSDWQIGDEADSGAVDISALGASAEEQDDAVAWLEGLAFKHGAKPEELVTDPNARTETAPDWVQKASQAGAEEQLSAEESVQPVQELEPVQEPEPEGPQAAVPSASVEDLGASAEEQDDAVAWLEGLAAKHGARPEELVTDPNARTETAPDWVQKASQAGAEEIASEELSVEEAAPAEAEPEWIKHAKEVGESLYTELEEAQTKEPLPAADADETGMWLRDLGEEAGFTEEQKPEPAAEDDLPDWLGGLESDQPKGEAAPISETPLGEDAGPVSEGEAEPEPPDWVRDMESRAPDSVAALESMQKPASEDLPSWLEGLDKDEEQQPAAAAEEIPGWLKDETEEEPAQPEPTTPTDWQPADAAEPAQAAPPEPKEEPAAAPEPEPPQPVEPAPESEPMPPQPVEPAPKPELSALPEREAYREPVTRSRTGMTGMLSSTQDPILIAAQNELTRSNIPAALEYYGKLIKKGKMLEEIIYDLREALYRFPVEVSIHQALGDAYMRANRLQDALDSYTKAEELLR